MRNSTEQETLKRKSEFQVKQNLRKDVYGQDKHCDRGDALFSSSGVCFESGVYRDVTHLDSGDTYMCSSGSCFECGF